MRNISFEKFKSLNITMYCDIYQNIFSLGMDDILIYRKEIEDRKIVFLLNKEGFMSIKNYYKITSIKKDILDYLIKDFYNKFIVSINKDEGLFKIIKNKLRDEEDIKARWRERKLLRICKTNDVKERFKRKI